MGNMDFPVIITCTLQGSSVTQGNPVTFTAKTFAVYHSSIGSVYVITVAGFYPNAAILSIMVISISDASLKKIFKFFLIFWSSQGSLYSDVQKCRKNTTLHDGQPTTTTSLALFGSCGRLGFGS